MTDLRQEAVRLVDFARTHIFFEATNAIERALAERERVIARLREALTRISRGTLLPKHDHQGDLPVVRAWYSAMDIAKEALSPTGESASQGTGETG